MFKFSRGSTCEALVIVTHSGISGTQNINIMHVQFVGLIFGIGRGSPVPRETHRCTGSEAFNVQLVFGRRGGKKNQPTFALARDSTRPAGVPRLYHHREIGMISSFGCVSIVQDLRLSH